MNTAERIVEAYFRHCLDCFTMTDVKVESGNNRQLDLVAVHLPTGEAFHVETSVKHPKSYWPTLAKLETAFQHKFLGAPRPNEKPTGDFALGKNYRLAIHRTYKRIGLTPSKVRRVYVCWALNAANDKEVDRFCRQFSRQNRLGRKPIEIWSFRDRVLPELSAAVGTSNYDDDSLRTLSLLAAAERQRARTGRS